MDTRSYSNWDRRHAQRISAFASLVDSDASKLLRFNWQLGEGVASVRHDVDDTLRWAVDISDRDECEREYQR